MEPWTLLPYNGSRRTGRLYDHPSEDGANVTISLSGKALLWPDRKLVQVRLWTAEADFWTHLVLDSKTHGVVASETAETESGAWDYLRRALKLKGYAI